MHSLFDSETNQDILRRINNLKEDTHPKWGKMDASQMLAHCCEPLKVPLGKLQLKKPNVFMKYLFSWFKDSLYNDKPWKHGLPTSKQYKVIDEKNFQEEQTRLVSLINEFYSKKNQTSWPPHPFCGNFTTEEWGKMQFKHLDHHLKQFGL